MNHTFERAGRAGNPTTALPSRKAASRSVTDLVRPAAQNSYSIESPAESTNAHARRMSGHCTGRGRFGLWFGRGVDSASQSVTGASIAFRSSQSSTISS